MSSSFTYAQGDQLEGSLACDSWEVEGVREQGRRHFIISPESEGGDQWEGAAR